MKNTKHPAALRLIYDVLNFIPEICSGTYNRADPTAFETGELQVNKDNKIIYHDCTWGVEIRLINKYLKDQEIYLSRGFGPNEEDELIPRDNWNDGSLLLLKKLLPAIKELGFDKEADRAYKNSPDYEEDPYGCLADYE